MPQDDNATRYTASERSKERVSRNDGSYSRSSTDSFEYTDSYGRAYQDAEHLSQSRYERQSPQQTSQTSRERESGTDRRRKSSSGRQSSDSRKRRSSSSSSRSSSRRSERPSDRRSSDRRSSDRRSSDRRSPGSRSERSSDRSRSSSASRSSRSSRGGQASRADRRQSSRRDQRQQSRDSGRQSSRRSQGQPSRKQSSSSSILDQLPSIAVPAGIAIIVIIVLLVAVFGVLSPSCSGTQTTPQTTASNQAMPVSSEPTTTANLVHQVFQAKDDAKKAVETASQSGALDTSNNKIDALVSLLGEEETAKLVAQARTNPDALWIAAHPDEYAFDGIEIQYKILKLAADEPAAIDYVREFPAKYPASDVADDKSLAMSVASPDDSVPNTNVPHLYQWDRRWAYTVYSSASFGLTGCGPTSLAMVYQGLNRTVDRTPHDMAVLAEERGFMSEFNGTDGSFFTSVAGELGLNCWESYPDAGNIRDELSQGHVIIANLGPGFFTTNGHFFVLAGLTDDGQVIVNDPYSVVRSSQTWDADFIASETIAMYVYSKA